MTRKDSEKDADRPHYYSQFWLDIAAGRRVIGGPKPEEVEANGNGGEAPEALPTRKAGRASDGYKETRARALAEPEIEEAEEAEEEEEFETEEAFDEVEQPDIDLDEEGELGEDLLEEGVEPEEDLLEEEVVPEEDLIEEEEIEPEEEEFFDEDEEEEEEDEWGRRGRKKPKPGRQVKPPAKKPRRDSRRGF